MRLNRTALTIAAALLSGAATLLAQTPPLPAASAAQGSTRSGPSAPGTTLRMHGTIAGYDREAQLLSLTTTTGVVHFDVPDSARIRLDGRKIERRVLVNLGGYSAAVHYSDTGGHTTLRSVDVFDKKERTRP